MMMENLFLPRAEWTEFAEQRGFKALLLLVALLL